jgi:hypothetical protein
MLLELMASSWSRPRRGGTVPSDHGAGGDLRGSRSSGAAAPGTGDRSGLRSRQADCRRWLSGPPGLQA